MFLKKIINAGFKSFADRITINLEKNHITGIVGPNGSGKSNVIDSVRWVMGEQNAKMLRGEKATDIIFAGSEKRKPLGMAEVTLVFDNSEGSTFCPPEYRHEPEISLTRRLYIDGQREYLINRKPCRLKDIVSFFASTGLGGRSYSMIQQGQVDRILQAKPEELREILEEAAGTLIFKRRKAEALKKLDATRLNLSRIDDILTEVERQKAALQSQVEKAKKYREIAAELREAEIEFLTHNHQDFKMKLLESESYLKEISDKEIALMGELVEFEGRFTELKEQLDEADPEVQALNEEIAVLREKIVRAETSLSNAQHLLAGSDEKLAKLELEIAEEDAALRKLEEEVEEKTRELASAESNARLLKDQLETLQYEMDTADEETQVFSNKIEEFQDEVRNLDRLLDNNTVRQEVLERDFSKSEREKNGLNERISILEGELGRALILVDAAQVKVSGRKRGLDAELQEKSGREIAINTRVEQIKNQASLRDSLKEKYFGAKGKFTSLQELELTANDVGALITRLKTPQPGQQSFSVSMLTELISFNDRSEELSERASRSFEKWAERVVVKDLNDFNQLVRIAHSQSIGGIPVTIIESARQPDQAAVIRWADKFDAEPFENFLKIDRQVPRLSELLSRIYHIATLALDTDTIAEMPHGIIAITAQGVIYTGADEYLIGTDGGKGALSRKTDLENLGVEVKSLEAGLAGAQGEIDLLEVKQAEDRLFIKETDQKLQSQNQAVLEVMTELQGARQTAGYKQEALESIKSDYEKLASASEQFGTDLVNLRKNRDSLSIEKEQTARELEDTKEQASSVIEKRDDLARLTGHRKIELAKGEAREQALKENHVSFTTQLENLQNKISRRYREKEELLDGIKSAKVNSVQLEVDIETFILNREEKEDVLAAKREQNSGIIEALRVTENRLRDIRSEQNKFQRNQSDKNLELERVRIGLLSFTEQATEKYQIDLDTYEFVRNPEFKSETRQRQVTTLRGKIETMGPINMMAIEEFDDLSRRESFINSQKDEVVSSVDLLETAIEEIESNSETKFMQTFKILNEEFQSLFPILFPGGDGKIVMTDETRPLDGGVEILVRLPGKKQQNMRLFSGGEKALTAIALIFALLKSKPTPFCFLDEVDAPLDETNVGRYNKVLEALSDRFQFIVITHNRRTMEVLDTLYGITMQEPGVSKVVGVDMSRDLPAHLKKAFKDGPSSDAKLVGASAE
jgi:chromosome segregation protein